MNTLVGTEEENEFKKIYTWYNKRILIQINFFIRNLKFFWQKLELFELKIYEL